MERSEYKLMFELEDAYWWFRGLHSIVKRLLRKVGTESLTVLDAGCGTGAVMKMLSREGVNAFGFDPSLDAVSFCRQRGLGRLGRGSIGLMPLRSGFVDAVVCLDVLCLKRVDVARALREMRRVLKPNGMVVLNVPAYQFLKSHHDELVDVAHRFSRRHVERVLAENGFQVIDAGYWNTFLFPLAAVFRLLDRRLRFKGRGLSDLRWLPDILNSLLCRLMALECGLSARVSFPFGLSVFCAARRRE